MADEETGGPRPGRWPESRRHQRTLAATPPRPSTIAVASLPSSLDARRALLAHYVHLHGGELRRILPPRAAHVLETIDLLTPFMVGFFAAARLPPAVARQATSTLRDPADQLAFLLGLVWGNGKGVAAAVADNVLGLYEVARLLYRYATPLGHVQIALEDVVSQIADPAAHRQRQREQWEQLAAALEAAKEFAQAVESNPSLLAASAFEMGHALGEEATRWSSEALLAKPFERGESLGRVFGTVVTEVVLCVVAPEALLAPALRAAAAAVRGSRLAQRLRPILGRLPGLRRLLALERERAAGRLAAGAAEPLPGAGRGAGGLEAAAATPPNVRPIGSARRRPHPQLERPSVRVSSLEEERKARRRLVQMEVTEQRLASGARDPITAARSVDEPPARGLSVVAPDDAARATRARSSAPAEGRGPRRSARGGGVPAERLGLLRALRTADRAGLVWPDGAFRLNAVVELYVGELLKRRLIRKLHDVEQVIAGHIGRSTFGKDYWGFVRAPRGQRGPVAIEVKWKPGALDVRPGDLQRTGDLQGSPGGDADDWLRWLEANRRRARRLVDEGLLDAEWLDAVWVRARGTAHFRRARTRYIVVVSPEATAGVAREALEALPLAAERVVRLREPANLRVEAERVARELAEEHR